MPNPRPHLCPQAPSSGAEAGTVWEEGEGGLGQGKETPISAPPCGHSLLGTDVLGPPTPLFHAAPGTPWELNKC